MGRLERAPDGQLAVYLVHAGDRAAGFQRAGMGAGVIDHFFGHDLGRAKRLFRRFLVAGFPQEDVVVMAARAVGSGHDAVEVLAQHGGIGFQRGEGVDDDGKFLVIHLDQFDGIGGDVAVSGNDEGDLLPLEQHLAIGKNHLLVTR